MKLFCVVVLCTCLFSACDKDNDEYEPVKPPIEQPEEPVEPEEPEEPDNPVTPLPIKDIINVKIGDLNMIVGSNVWNDVTYGNGKYVAVGADGYTAYSYDGENWTPIKIGYTEYIMIIYTNGKFIALGGSGLSGKLVHSEDGINWTSVDSPMGNNGSMKSIAYGNGKYCLVGNNGQMYTSNDLKSWSKVSGYNVERVSWSSIAYGNGKFVAIGSYSNASVAKMISEDGINWTFPTGYFKGPKIIFENNNFISFGSSSIIYYSINGNEWNNTNVTQSLISIMDISYANGKFVALRGDKSVTFSEDLIDWTTPEKIKDESGNDITVSLKGICAVH